MKILTYFMTIKCVKTMEFNILLFLKSKYRLLLYASGFGLVRPHCTCKCEKKCDNIYLSTKEQNYMLVIVNFGIKQL